MLGNKRSHCNEKSVHCHGRVVLAWATREKPTQQPRPSRANKNNNNTISSVQFARSLVSDFLQPHRQQHASLPCPSPIPGAYLNSCPSSQWFHPTISFSVVPFSSCLQSFPASGSFTVSQFFTSGAQSIGALALVLPMNIHDWFL